MVGSVVQREMGKLETGTQTTPVGIVNDTLSNTTTITEHYVNPVKLGLAMSVTFLAGFLQVLLDFNHTYALYNI